MWPRGSSISMKAYGRYYASLAAKSSYTFRCRLTMGPWNHSLGSVCSTLSVGGQQKAVSVTAPTSPWMKHGACELDDMEVCPREFSIWRRRWWSDLRSRHDVQA